MRSPGSPLVVVHLPTPAPLHTWLQGTRSHAWQRLRSSRQNHCTLILHDTLQQQPTPNLRGLRWQHTLGQQAPAPAVPMWHLPTQCHLAQLALPALQPLPQQQEHLQQQLVRRELPLRPPAARHWPARQQHQPCITSCMPACMVSPQ